MFCTQCGTKNNETSNFCIQCGKPLTAKRTETAPQQAQPLSVGSLLRVEIKKEPLFFECLNSFERLENLSAVTTKCKKAIEAGLHPIDEAIVHGLLMHRYAKQKDLEKAQEEQLRSREVIGRIIGLSNQELQIFMYEPVEQEYWRILDRLVGCTENIARRVMIDEILICPVYPSGFRADLTDKEKREAALECMSDFFPGPTALYSLLGDLWTNNNVNYAIECFKIVEKHEMPRSPNQLPTTAAFMCGYKLGNLYRRKGDTTLAIREFNKVLAFSSHPKVMTLSDEERGLGDYWVNKARKELAEIKR